MPYVGNNPAANFASVTKDTFSGDGSTTAFTLSKAATTNGVAVFVENVRQEPTIAYAVSGTTLTFTAAPVTSSGNNIYVLHHNAPASTVTHPAAQPLTATSGTFSAGVSGTTGTFTSDVSMDGGSFVFNESGAAKDFRVEGDTKTHMLFVDGSADVVGIGGTPATGNNIVAHIQQGDSGAAAGDGFHSYSNLIVETNNGEDGGGISIHGDNGSLVQLAFADPDDANVGVIFYQHSNNQMSFLTNAGERLRIASDGTLTGSDTDGIGSLSDQRLKTNIKDYNHDLESFKKLKPKTFDWKNPSEHGDKSGVRGFIAQDLLDADSYTVYQEPVSLPEYDDKDSHTEGDGSDYDLILPNDKGERLSYASKLGGNDAMYVSVIQQLIARIEALESK